MAPDRRRDERGSVLLTLSVLALGGIVMLGVAVDLARVAAAWREASHAASSAAEAGAGWIDEDQARDGHLVLDAARAGDAAGAVAAGPGRQVAVEVGPQRVCVTVTKEVAPSILRAVGATPAAVSARGCAEPRKG